MKRRLSFAYDDSTPPPRWRGAAETSWKVEGVLRPRRRRADLLLSECFLGRWFDANSLWTSRLTSLFDWRLVFRLVVTSSLKLAGRSPWALCSADLLHIFFIRPFRSTFYLLLRVLHPVCRPLSGTDTLPRLSFVTMPSSSEQNRNGRVNGEHFENTFL